jgi:hypothetical protein
VRAAGSSKTHWRNRTSIRRYPIRYPCLEPMKTNDLPDRCVSQLLSWCLEWLELPLYFAAQNTESWNTPQARLLAHTFPVVLTTQEVRSPFREMPSEWQIIMTADQFSPQGLVLRDVQTQLVPRKSVHMSPPLKPIWI